MKPITRLASIISAIATLAAPSLAFADQVYANSNGAFGYFSPGFSFSVGGAGTFMCGASNICYVASTILYIINNVLVPVIFALAFIVFLYGIAKAYIFSMGSEDAVKDGHRLILWGIIGFVVMVSLWGLVNVVANTFGLAGSYAPPTPSSISPYGSAVPIAAPPVMLPSGTTYGQQAPPAQSPTPTPTPNPAQTSQQNGGILPSGSTYGSVSAP